MEDKSTRYSVTIDPDIKEYAESREAALNKTYRYLLRRGYEIETADEPIPEKLKTQSDKHYVEISTETIQYAREVTGDIDQDADSQIRQWIRERIEQHREEKEIRKTVIANVQTQMISNRVTPSLNGNTPPTEPAPSLENKTNVESVEAIKDGKPSWFKRVLSRR